MRALPENRPRSEGVLNRCSEHIGADVGEHIGAHFGEPGPLIDYVSLIDPANEAADYPDQQHVKESLHSPSLPRLPPTLAISATIDVISGQTNHPRDHLCERKLEPVALFTKICRQHIDRDVRDRTIRRNRQPQGRREAFFLRIAGFAIDD
jgi:hypothetical protein